MSETPAPLCPGRDCRQPLELTVDDDEYVHWWCPSCGTDYTRRQFPVLRAVLDKHAAHIKTEARRDRQEEDRRRLQAWNEAMSR